jgi:hypothetical protein
MIFTSRFGALAARRTFPHVDEVAQEPHEDQLSVEAELEAVTAENESESVYVGSR